MTAVHLSPTISGPIFDPAAPALVDSALADAVREVAEAGVERLTSAFPAGLPVKTGNLRRNVNPMIAGAYAQIDDGGVIYSPWIEGTSSRNQTTRFKGYSTWRKTVQYLRDEIVPAVAEKTGVQISVELGGVP